MTTDTSERGLERLPCSALNGLEKRREYVELVDQLEPDEAGAVDNQKSLQRPTSDSKSSAE